MGQALAVTLGENQRSGMTSAAFSVAGWGDYSECTYYLDGCSAPLSIASAGKDIYDTVHMDISLIIFCQYYHQRTPPTGR